MSIAVTQYEPTRAGISVPVGGTAADIRDLFSLENTIAAISLVVLLQVIVVLVIILLC